MTQITYTNLRKIIVDVLKSDLKRVGILATDLDDSTDLLTSAIIDSFGYLDLIFHLEERSGIPIDLAAMGNAPITTVKGLIDSLLSQKA
jgi:acyl carrier protein